MAIEYKNKITLTKDSVVYAHQSVDEGGFPKNAGNAKVSEILDLAEEQAKERLKGNVVFSVDSSNLRLYHLSLYGESVASFEVPDDKYLKSVSFDETTNKLKFTFVVDEKESVVYVDLSSLIRTYTAGNGLTLSNGKFSLVVKSGEAHLKVGTDGVYLDLSDITTALSGKAASDHNHDGRYYTETEMDTKLSGKAASSHTHDDRYYTESEVDTKLSGKAASSHTHDDRYYTESEVDTKLGEKADSSHTHDDRYYTESEMDTKLSGKAASSHTHDDRYYTESEVDSKLSGKASSSHTHTTIGDGTMQVYGEYSNEVNFGGTNNSTTIYFGYRAKDSKAIPTQFIFGGSSGSATIKAAAVYGAVFN